MPTTPLVTSQGSGKSLIQPVLDNQLKAASPLVLPQRNWMTALPQEEALDLIKDAFVAAGERDIYTVSHCLRCSSSLTWQLSCFACLECSISSSWVPMILTHGSMHTG